MTRESRLKAYVHDFPCVEGPLLDRRSRQDHADKVELVLGAVGQEVASR